ncbi:MAG: nitroreductase family protein [Nanoarchaeota archaeon]|nr:nitroreductase family protein [Nanoarchaeota archaeon]
MDALACIKTRRSIRQYTNKPIDKNILQEIIDAARLAPSARNIQPWHFIVVTEKETLKKIANLTDYGSFIADAAACIVVCCEDTKYYLEDGCNASENILLAAKSFGIGSCWVAGDKKDYCKDIKELIGVPPDYKIISLLPLGYPISDVQQPPKKRLDEIIHWEKFHKK